MSTKTCRICHLELDLDQEKDKLVSPCHCHDHDSLIHLECFQDYEKTHCEVCQFKFYSKPQIIDQQQMIDSLPEMINDFPVKYLVEQILVTVNKPGITPKTKIWWIILRELCRWKKGSSLKLMVTYGILSLVSGLSCLSIPLIKSYYASKIIRPFWEDLPYDSQVVLTITTLIPFLWLLSHQKIPHPLKTFIAI